MGMTTIATKYEPVKVEITIVGIVATVLPITPGTKKNIPKATMVVKVDVNIGIDVSFTAIIIASSLLMSSLSRY